MHRVERGIACILNWLDPDNSGIPDVSAMIALRDGKLLPEVERLRSRLAARLSNYYRENGYVAKAFH